MLDIERDEREHSVVLIEINGMAEIYMTLSHCWGATHPLTTTRPTLEERKKEFSYQISPEHSKASSA